MKLLGFLRREDVKAYLLRSWSVSWPMTLIMFFDFLIGLTDVYIAGRISKEIQATYGFVIQIYFILIVVANAVTVGTVSVAAKLFTSGDRDELTKAISSSLFAAAISGLLLAASGALLGPLVIPLLNIPDAIKEHAAPFIQIYAAGLFFHYLLINGNGILRSCNRVKKSLRTMALVCVLNIGLNFFLVFHTSVGFRSIALATASSVLIGSIINLMTIRRLMTGVKQLSLDRVKKIFGIGWPLGLLQVLWQLSSMALYLILSALPENRVEILAALTTGLRIESAIYLPVIGSNMANAVVVANLLGEKRKEEAFRSGMVTAGIGVAIVTLMVAAVVLNARWIASYLSNNEIVVRESIRYLYISMISEPFMAWGVILAGGLNGSGDTRNVLIRVGIGLWVVRIPLSYLSVVWFGLGAVSVWWAMNLSLFVQCFLISKRYFSRKWL